MTISLDMEITSQGLLPNMMAVMLIIVGLISGEKVVEQRMSIFGGDDRKFAVFAVWTFIVGWVWFLYNDYSADRNVGLTPARVARRAKSVFLGAMIPVFAIAGQLYLYYTCTLGRPLPSLVAMVVMGGFVGFWVAYLLEKSRNDHGDLIPECLAINFMGMALLMMGMMWYFSIRNSCAKSDMVDKRYFGGLFNPSLVLVSFGWVLLAMGNSVPAM
jgi:RsiW-degrading membrane proteinase PrsW (M82 family)